MPGMPPVLPLVPPDVPPEVPPVELPPVDDGVEPEPFTISIVA